MREAPSLGKVLRKHTRNILECEEQSAPLVRPTVVTIGLPPFCQLWVTFCTLLDCASWLSSCGCLLFCTLSLRLRTDEEAAR